MNKAQLIEELTDRLGDKKTATAAVDNMVDVIVRTVNKGDKVNITGFGVFEKRARAARTARNPRTGEPVRVRKTNVPAFRAGTHFKEVISGAKKLPRATKTSSARGTSAQSTTSTRGTAAKSTTASKTTAAKSTAAKSTAAKSTTASKSSTAKAAPKTSTRSTAAKSTSSRGTTTTSTAKRTTSTARKSK